jgi:hypothetical protein
MSSAIYNVRMWIYEQNKACVDLQTELTQERILNHQKHAALAKRIKDLESNPAAATGKKTGEQEMEERWPQAHELQSGLAQPTRWLRQGGHAPGDDGTPANEKQLERAESATSFATACEESLSPGQSVIQSEQLLEQVGRKRPKRRR